MEEEEEEEEEPRRTVTQEVANVGQADGSVRLQERNSWYMQRMRNRQPGTGEYSGPDVSQAHSVRYHESAK